MGADLAKGKKQAPLLVRLQESSDMKHFDSYARNKALRADLRVCSLWPFPRWFQCPQTSCYVLIVCYTWLLCWTSYVRFWNSCRHGFDSTFSTEDFRPYWFMAILFLTCGLPFCITIRPSGEINLVHYRWFALFMSLDFSSLWSLLSNFQAQKKRVAAETEEARKMGLGIRLLPASKDDADQAANIKFAQKFGLNQRNKRAAIQASSIFLTDSSKQSPQTPWDKFHSPSEIGPRGQEKESECCGREGATLQ